MLRTVWAFLAATLCLLLSATANAEPVSTGFFGSVAIGGKDTVSYHGAESRRAHVVAEGDRRHEVEYLGATWRVASRQSAERFAADPAAYVPRYNGHCANALSLGEGLVRTDGSVWEFFGDQLYLFYAEAGRQRWLGGDWQRYRTQADAAWRTIVTNK